MVVCGLALPPATTRASDSAPQFGALADFFVSERDPTSRWVGAIGLGWEPLSLAAATYELGYGWGSHADGLFGSTDLLHVSLSGHLGVRPTSDTEVHGTVAAQFGAVTNGLNTYGLSGGFLVDIDDELDFGPVISGRLGILHLTVRATLWLGTRDELDVGAVVGVELFGTR